MKKKKIIALGLASCVLLSQPIYASSLIKEAPITLTVQREGVKNIGFKTKQMYTQEEGFILNIRIPVIQGLKDIKFQEKLNEKIEKEMMKDKKNMEQDVKKHLHQAKKEGVEVIPYEMYVDYDIKSNGDILSFTITTATSFGNNWMERVDSYNIDCKQNKLLDLKDLFKNGSDYKKIITDQIQQEMKEQIQSGKGNYFEEEIDFKNISAVQSFYIQGNNIVITFPKYSIAPGSMGTPEFKIPFSLLKNVLKTDIEQGISVIEQTKYETTDYFIQEIRVPEIQGLTDLKFQEELNKKMTAHLPELIKNLEQESKEHMEEAKKEKLVTYPYGIYVDYDIKSMGDILSFTVTTFEATGGTGAPRVDYYNIDTKTNKELRLDDLLINHKEAKKVINTEIEKQIKEQMETDTGMYFEGEDGFRGIDDNQDFYIQGDYLVICFPKYSIAPGYMGTPEFKIPFSFR